MPTPMMKQYFSFKRKHPDALILMRMGDFFEMFHEDAKIGSKLLNITLTKRNNGKGGDGEVALAGFPHHKLEAYLIKLNRAGKKTVVVDQIEDPKQAIGLVKRDIVRIVTSGTYLGEEDIEGDVNQYLAAIIPDKKSIGLALCDVTTGEFYVSSIPKIDIKDKLDLLRPSEIIYCEDQRDEVLDLISKKPMMTPLPVWVFEESFSRDTLLGHFKTKSLKGFGIEDDILAISSAGAILHYVRENLCTKPDHIRSLSKLSFENYLLIDQSTRRNLEIVDPIRGGESSTTLFRQLDRTVTPFGRRLFVGQLLRPLKNIKEIEKRLDSVDEFVVDRLLREGLRDRLRGIGDIERLIARIALGRGTPRDVGAIRDTLGRIPLVKRHLENAKSKLVKADCKSLNPLDKLVELLKQSIVDEPPATLAKGGAIRDGYNDRLDSVRTIATGGKEFILKRQNEERESTGISSLHIGYNKVFGYYIEVTRANVDKVPDYYIRKQTLVNAERYITPELKEWEEKILTAEEEALEIEQRLFEEIRIEIAKEAEIIQHNAHYLADLDTLSAAAQLAADNKYNRPTFCNDGRLTLVRSRHPVIENLLGPGESFIANDLEIGSDRRQIALVTGPNMGGKSTYLRQIGLIVIMAHVGLFVPADKAEIPLTDRVFTRVGASDNLAGGESTFLVEMHEAANILHNATNESLILFDEIGRGTSTFDGLSIAWSMVEYLHDFPEKARPKTLFATHYHELTELETILERVYNLHVEIKEWGEGITFLRKVTPGRSGASYGIQVAKLAGVPQPVIERAQQVLDALEASEFTEENIPRIAANSKTSSIPPKLVDPQQASLFTVEERAVRDELARADLDNITPLEALRLLADLREKYGSTDLKNDSYNSKS
jgi:DNA mismatch repair protein MutS